MADEAGTPDIDMLLRTQLEMFRGMMTDMMSLRTTVRGMTADMEKMGKAERSHYDKLLKDLEYASNAQKSMAENMLEYATRPKVPLPLDIGKEIGRLLDIHRKVVESAEKELSARERLTEIAKEAETKTREALETRAAEELAATPDTRLTDISTKYKEEALASDSEAARLQEASFKTLLTDVLEKVLEPIVTSLSAIRETMISPSAVTTAPASDTTTAATEVIEELRESVANLNPFVQATVVSFGLMRRASIGLTEALFGTRNRTGELGAAANFVSNAFSFVATRVQRASDSYDAFVEGTEKFIAGVKRFFTLEGLLAFAIRAAAIPIFYTANLLKDGFKSLKEMDWKDVGNKVKARLTGAFDAVGKAANFLRDGFGKGMTAIGNGVSAFGGMMSRAASAVMAPLMSFAATIFTTVIPAILGFAASIFTTVIPAVIGFAVSIFTTVVPAILGFAMTIIGAAIPPIIAIGAAILSGVVAVATFVGSLLAAAAPFILIGVAIGLVIYGLYLMYQRFEWVQKAVELYIEGMKLYMNAINDYIIQPLIQAGKAVVDFYAGMWDMFRNSAIGKWLLGDDSKKTGESMKQTSDIAKRMQQDRVGMSMAELRKEKQYLDSADYAKEIMQARERGDEAQVNRLTARQRAVSLEINRRSQLQSNPMILPEGGTVKQASPVVVVNQATAAPVVSGGGGQGGQAGFVPVRNQNETIKDFQLANIPRG